MITLSLKIEPSTSTSRANYWSKKLENKLMARGVELAIVDKLRHTQLQTKHSQTIQTLVVALSTQAIYHYFIKRNVRAGNHG